MSEGAPKSPSRFRFERRHLDLILALAAIFISAVSLLVAIRTEQSQRATLAADTWPFVQRNISGGSEGNADMTVGISNDGVGPAKIRSVEIFYRGRPVSSVLDLLRRCCGYRDDISKDVQLPERYTASIADNTVLRAGEQNLMFRIHPSATAPTIPERLKPALRELTFRGCYCSVLDECWTSDLASTTTTPVKACPVPAHPFDPLGR